MMVFTGVLIATIILVMLATAIFCYIKQLERQIEILEVKVSMIPLPFVCDEASLSLNNISDK